VVDTAGASNMAQIDPNIALQGRVIQLPNQLAQFSQAQDIGLNALKMQEYQKGIAQENKLRELLAGGADLNSPETIRQMYNISPKMGAEFEKSRAVLKKEQTAADKNVADLESQLVKNARDTLGAVNDQSTYDMWRQQTISKLPGLAQLVPPQFSPQAKMSLMADANKYIEQNQISAAQKAQMGVTMRGQDITDARARETQQMQFNPQLQATIAQAKEYGQALGKNRALAEAALPGAIQTADESIRLIDEMVGKAPVRDKSGKVIEKGTAPHPGFSSYVGASILPGQRFIEGSPTASFEVRQKQIEGKAFLEAFNALKGGGSITEKEGEKGTAAIMRMNKASSEREYVAAARELQDIMRKGVERAKTKAGGGASAAPSGGGNVIDFNSLN
jgi:hypothetical protein